LDGKRGFIFHYKGGEEFGLGIFLGEKGYKRYLAIISDNPEEDDFSESIMTPMLSLLFANRQDLQKQDIEVIRSLGLQFRGRMSWPLFRSQNPGYAPWFLEKDEVTFLTIAIEQALIISGKVQNNGLDLYEQADEDLIFTRFCNGGEWKEEWRKPAVSYQKSSRVKNDITATEEAELLLLSGKERRGSGAWELDIFILPTPIGSKSTRPYFPLSFLVVDEQQGIVIDNKMTEPWLNPSQQRGVIIEILKNTKQLPMSICVRSRKVKEIIEPLARHLGINIQTGTTPLLDEFKASLSDYLS
jgi:hypothetical protein